MRLFLDANVLFGAAYNPAGRAAALVDLAGLRGHALLASPHVLDEARHNLSLKKPEARERLEGEVLRRVSVVPEAGTEAVRVGLEKGLPLKDAPVLGAVLREEVDLLVTSDLRHFGRLMGDGVGGMVVTPEAALQILLQQAEEQRP